MTIIFSIMDNENIGLCGRTKEISQIQDYLKSCIDAKKSGVLYLAGPPGTGKTMSIQYVLNRLKSISILNLNCAKAQSSKVILKSMCRGVGLERFANASEVEMIERLTKKFSSRVSKPYLIVLDEMDRLPKSKNEDLFKQIFSWPNESNSKLILIGIANTFNLDPRFLSRKDRTKFMKIIFTPYKSKQIREILRWYLENDENFEGSQVDMPALQLISAKFADTGDIRGAVNALRSCLDDTSKSNRKKYTHPQSAQPKEDSIYPTPPSTPPLTPRKNTTNIASVSTSIRKRSIKSLYEDDSAPFQHEFILTCIYKLCSTKERSTKVSTCTALAEKILLRLNFRMTNNELVSILDNLEAQGMIRFKKGKGFDRIVLLATESQIDDHIKNKDQILTILNRYE